MKKVKYPEEPGLFIKDAYETIENEVKRQKDGFLVMLLSTLDAASLRDQLADKTVYVADEVIWADERPPEQTEE